MTPYRADRRGNDAAVHGGRQGRGASSLRVLAWVVAASWLSTGCEASETRRQWCPGAEQPIDASSYGVPFAHMRLGSVTGAFLIDTGTTFSVIDGATAHLPIGAAARLEGSTLPTLGWATVRVAGLAGARGPAPVAGIIGTDVLAGRTFELHLDAEQPYAVVSERPCDAATLAAAGFARVDQGDGFVPPGRRPRDVNIPSVLATFGRVSFRTWVDSGFHEATRRPAPGVMKVNDAAIEAIGAAGVRLVDSGTVSSTPCSGVPTLDRVYRVEGRVELTTEGGEVFDEIPDLVVQRVGPDACGGIGSRRTPTGLIGAWYLSRWGTTILDPLGGAVWVERRTKGGEKR